MQDGNNRLKFRERIFKKLFLASDQYKVFIAWLTGICRFCFTVSFLLFLIGSLFYLGFTSSEETLTELKSAFRILFLILFISKYLPEFLRLNKPLKLSTAFRVAVFIYSFIVFLSNVNQKEPSSAFMGFFHNEPQIIIAIILLGISEISGLFPGLRLVRIPPALIFSLSFIFIIFTGSGLLMLPNAHTGHLEYLDALFTSASAVCVTGLTTVDTATAFTIFGKLIILSLIQVGGLGIMTFTGFFSYIFTSRASFTDRILLRELFSAESLNNLFKILAKIIIFTFLIEIAGALFIYSSLGNSFGDRIFFSIFHSVSAFCNAGFSTLSDNLYSIEIRGNSILQISVALLIVLGGLGFPVLLDLYSGAKYRIIVFIRRLQRKRIPLQPFHRHIATSVVLFMTVFLIVTGAVLYFLFESSGSLASSSTKVKLIQSFFGSISARTAGFSVTDLSRWSYPTVFFMIGLMWIGASPGSTGGGIKTTTFALAFRSTWNNIRGGEKLKMGNREIGNSTIRRVLSIIFLSLLVIATGFLILLISEPGKDPSYLLFECVSAYSTVGLSLADSSLLSDTGKLVDILLMFTGRVGPLTLLIGFFQTYRKKYAAYPEIDIVIN